MFCHGNDFPQDAWTHLTDVMEIAMSQNGYDKEQQLTFATQHEGRICSTLTLLADANVHAGQTNMHNVCKQS